MKIFLSLIYCLVISFLLISCSKTSTENFNSGGGVPAKYIYLLEDKFTPVNVSYYKGAYVTFTNQSTKTHKLLSTDSTIRSGMITPGTSYTIQLLNAGIYDYRCTEHNEQGVIEIISQ